MAEPGGGPTIGRVKVEFVGDNTKLKQTAAESKRVAEGVGAAGARSAAAGGVRQSIRGVRGLLGIGTSLAAIATLPFVLGRAIREALTGEHGRTERDIERSKAALSGDTETLKQMSTDAATILGIVQGMDGVMNQLYFLLQGFTEAMLLAELGTNNTLIKINTDFFAMRKLQQQQHDLMLRTNQLMREAVNEMKEFSRRQLEQAADASRLTWPYPIYGPR